MTFHITLQPNTFYHVFSRAIGDEKLFRNEENFKYFLEKYNHYISPVAETYAYCLLTNHFHFLIKIKDPNAIITYSEKQHKDFSTFIMQAFSNFLNSYTKAFNKVFDRRGGLFIDHLRRVEISSNEQLRATLFYIHKNPVHHGLCRDIMNWRWSSYRSFLSSADTLLKRLEVIEWFGDKDEFLEFHQQPIYLKNAVVLE
jgi:REP element-mobilizing transposase RayT